MGKIKSITVFCGSTMGSDPKYLEETQTFADEMAKRGLDLVYGGGNRGLMGRLADRLKSAGRHVTGILPKKMDIPSVRTKDVENDLIVTDGMHERKEKMYEKGDAFVALPGGIGTLEELMEIYTWQELGYHGKPVALLNSLHYYDLLLQFLRHSVQEGFLRKEYFDALIVEENPCLLLDRVMQETIVSLPDKLS